MKKVLRALVVLTGLLLPLSVPAQDDDRGADSRKGLPTMSDEAQANNPLADFQAFNLHNYYIPEISGPGDETANSFILRYAQPFGKWLMRASLPFNRVPTGTGESVSGVGDFDVFFAYLFDTGNPARSAGIGPQLVLPTGREETGSGKTQLGLAGVYFDATQRLFQWGGLLIWRTDVAGDDDRDDVNVVAAQPFYFFQLGEGRYLRGAPIWVFDIEQETYHVPVGLGYGKVIKAGRTVYNIFAEPQFTILEKGPGQPEFQLFFGWNMQFK